jgi:hypothetical protein
MSKQPIDYTDYPGEHIGEIDEQTVSGSSADDDGEQKTAIGLDRIPDGLLPDTMDPVLLALLTADSVDEAAEAAGCSQAWVRKTQSAVAAFYQPDEVPLLIPEDPTIYDGVATKAASHPDARQAVRDKVPPENEVTRASDRTLEVMGRHEVLEQDVATIRDEMGLSTNEVNGSLSNVEHVPRSAYIVPDEPVTAGSDGGGGGGGDDDGNSNDNTDSQDSHRGELAVNVEFAEPDLRACECSVPELLVDRTAFGPDSLQGLFCARCDHRFTALWGEGDE